MPVSQVRILKNSRQVYHLRNLFYRNKSSLRLWEEDINTEIKLNIEKHWAKEVVSKTVNNNSRQSYYVLPMFPYPSGNLHMGHVRVYSISDTLARFQQLNGMDAIHPIGWDAFGLPAENAAIERNIPPHLWTKSNINAMRHQLQQLAFKFDWDREISTCDPNYYKWTQYIFLKLFEKDLAYQKKAEVNWDPIDKTVLADEQVDDLGCSWRSGSKVEKKHLTQWFIRTTKFAKDLYDGLDSKDLENWKDIINLQKHWIGNCNGVVITFEMTVNNQTMTFDVWTADPYKLIYGNFLLMNPSHALLMELKDTNMKSLTCYNPITEQNIPVYITTEYNYPEGREVSIACTLFDEEDHKIAQTLNLPISNEKINKIDFEYENRKAVDIANEKKVGGHFVSPKLKDWLISRQRYWGTPIPIIHCNKCGTVPVPYEELPVKLPKMNATKTGIQTLEKLDWVDCKCPKCLSNAKRETDTMDTFVDSSWYYYRFLDPHNENAPFSKEAIQNNMPVDIYIGGKEHAVLHLYYARFMSYFFHSLGWSPTREPFKKLVVQGMVMGQSYKVKSTGKYIPPEQVEKEGKIYKEKCSGQPVLTQWEKMSKSKYNGENPERLLSTYGCDTTRLLILADVPPATPRRWSDATLPGVLNWQHRLWMTIRELLKHRNNIPSTNILTLDEFQKFETKFWDSRNFLTATTTYHFKYTQKLSVGISRLQSLTNVLRNNVPAEVMAKSKEFEKALAALIIMLSPVMPHFCSELWAGFLSAPHRICETSSLINWQEDVLNQKWPIVDDHYKLSFLCKVDGADRCELKIEARNLINLQHNVALQMMLEEEAIKKTTKRGIHKTKYELYPDCRAILHIFTKRKEKSVIVEESICA